MKIIGFSLIVTIILVVLMLNYLQCERRLTDAEQTTVDKRYLVYVVWEVVNKEFSIYKNRYIDVLCGGVILTPMHILTSAACLTMKIQLYVIAGYRKYIKNGSGEDKCLEVSRRRIGYKCTIIQVAKNTWKDKAYYENTTAWTTTDIGVARIDKPYDFTNKEFLTHCSYIPNAAKLSYDRVKPGTQVIVLGWGSDKYQRPEGYHYDPNQEYFMSLSTVVIDKEGICKEEYAKVNVSVDSKICTNGPGKLAANGTYIGDARRDNSNNSYEDIFRYAYNINDFTAKDRIVLFYSPQNNSRRYGPCENDHGGPLVAWIEGVEHVVGLVIGYLVDDKMRCTGPYIYQSFENLQEFISCATEVPGAKKLKMCPGLQELKGYKIKEEYTDWMYTENYF